MHTHKGRYLSSGLLASRKGRSLRSHTHPSTHRERLNTPNNDILFRHVLGTAYTGLELRGVGVTGHGHRYLHAVGHRLLLKLPLGLSEERVWGVKNSLLHPTNIQALSPHDLRESLRSPEVGTISLPVLQMRKWRQGKAKAFAWRCTANMWQAGGGVTPTEDSRGSVLSAFFLQRVQLFCLVQNANDAHHRGVFT